MHAVSVKSLMGVAQQVHALMTEHTLLDLLVPLSYTTSNKLLQHPQLQLLLQL